MARPLTLMLPKQKRRACPRQLPPQAAGNGKPYGFTGGEFMAADFTGEEARALDAFYQERAAKEKRCRDVAKEKKVAARS